MKLRANSGFTLVETVIALTVTALLAMAIMSFMVDGLVHYTQESARSDLLDEAHAALDIMSKDIRLSANADQNNRWQDNYAPSAPSDLYSWQSGANTLVLAAAAEDSSNNILFEDPSQYISYKNNDIFWVQNGTLYKRVLAAPVSGNTALNTCPSGHTSATCPVDKELAHNVSAFNVSYLDGQGQAVGATDARAIELTLTLQTHKYGSNISETYTTRMVFRND